MALLTYGEGWHNNHHAFPTSARHGLRWWELDLTYGAIRVLSALGLAHSVKLPKFTSASLLSNGAKRAQGSAQRSRGRTHRRESLGCGPTSQARDGTGRFSPDHLALEREASPSCQSQ